MKNNLTLPTINEVRLRNLEILRNKALCSHTQAIADRAYEKLLGLLEDHELSEIRIARSEWNCHGCTEEFYDLMKTLQIKYEHNH